MKPYYQTENVRLYHGDCRNFLGHVRYDILLTDPPYGMGWVVSGHRVAEKYDKIVGDDQFPKEVVRQLIKEALAAAYVFCRWDNLIAQELPTPKSVLCWVKNNWGLTGIGDIHIHRRQWEAIAFYPRKHHRFRKQISDVQFCAKVYQTRHPTEKPIGLLNRLIACNDGRVVFDPYAGSGTTLLAALECGRKAIGVEIDEHNCEVAAKRLAHGGWRNII